LKAADLDSLRKTSILMSIFKFYKNAEKNFKSNLASFNN